MTRSFDSAPCDDNPENASSSLDLAADQGLENRRSEEADDLPQEEDPSVSPTPAAALAKVQSQQVKFQKDQSRIVAIPLFAVAAKYLWAWLAAGVSILAIFGFAGGFKTRQQSLQIADLHQQLKDNRIERDRLRAQLDVNQAVVATLGRPQTQVHSLLGAGQSPNATASLLAIPGEPEMVFVAQSLPPLEKSQVYRLWSVVNASDALLFCGQFRLTADGTARWAAPEAACTLPSQQLLITLDAAQAPITAAGSPVLRTET